GRALHEERCQTSPTPVHASCAAVSPAFDGRASIGVDREREGQAMPSIWMPCEPPLASSAPLSGDVEVDVAVVGGGITGVLVAHRLKRAGFEVAIIESHCVGGSNTGLSTGNLYASVSSSMDAVLKRWGEDVLSQVV